MILNTMLRHRRKLQNQNAKLGYTIISNDNSRYVRQRLNFKKIL